MVWKTTFIWYWCDVWVCHIGPWCILWYQDRIISYPFQWTFLFVWHVSLLYRYMVDLFRIRIKFIKLGSSQVNSYPWYFRIRIESSQLGSPMPLALVWVNPAILWMGWFTGGSFYDDYLGYALSNNFPNLLCQVSNIFRIVYGTLYNATNEN